MRLLKGDKVKGIFSGKYLGIVIGFSGSDVILRAPGDSVVYCSRIMVERVQDIALGSFCNRVWVI